jgi:UDP-2,3-diacylglucosamine pyrophosphatase LpxH
MNELFRDREPSVYHRAEMLLQRGFDAVVFGHTHHAESVELMPGKHYLNSGNWMHGGTYVQITNGAVSL